MLEALVGLLTIPALVIMPLLWRVWADHRRARALVLEADIRAAVRRALGGESLLSVHVTPERPGRAGQVTLTTPSGWGWLVEAAWEAVMDRVPNGWEVVVRGAHASASLAATEPAPLPRAA
jgi:hypothetical protein